MIERANNFSIALKRLQLDVVPSYYTNVQSSIYATRERVPDGSRISMLVEWRQLLDTTSATHPKT